MIKIPERDMRAVLFEALAKPAWRSFDPALLHGLEIKELTSDSREVKPGVAFAGFPGEGRDGREFIGDAIARGASTVLWDANNFQWRSEWQLPNVGIPDLKFAIGLIAGAIFGKPSKKLWAVGVTGTNGKTS